MVIFGEIQVREEVGESYTYSSLTPLVDTMGWTASLRGAINPVRNFSIEMFRSGATPEEAVSNLKVGLRDAGLILLPIKDAPVAPPANPVR